MGLTRRQHNWVVGVIEMAERNARNARTPEEWAFWTDYRNGAAARLRSLMGYATRMPDPVPVPRTVPVEIPQPVFSVGFSGHDSPLGHEPAEPGRQLDAGGFSHDPNAQDVIGELRGRT